MMSVALTNEGPVTFILDSRSESSDAIGSSGSQSGKTTPRESSTPTAAERAAEKARRKAAWEASKKQKGQEEVPINADPSPDTAAA